MNDYCVRFLIAMLENVNFEWIFCDINSHFILGIRVINQNIHDTLSHSF